MKTLSVDGESRRERWIPWLFVMGFLVVIGVNATLIVAAAQTFSGLVVAHPYQEGNEYNQIRAQIEAQEKLGWRYTLRTEPGRDGNVHLTVTWRDKSGLPIDGLAIAGQMQRPVENMAAVPAAFRSSGSGSYVADIALPKGGVWDLHISAARRNIAYAAAERLVLP